jgi:hypothetical protein
MRTCLEQLKLQNTLNRVLEILPQRIIIAQPMSHMFPLQIAEVEKNRGGNKQESRKWTRIGENISHVLPHLPDPKEVDKMRLPEPGKVERDRRKGRTPGLTLSNAFCVATSL